MKQVVDHLYDLPHYTSKNPMDHTRELLRRLGDPQDEFAVIHIAGSNGKGSTASFLFSMLKAAGVHTGLFTSPHLCDIRERFMTTDGVCEEEEFLAAFEKVRSVADEMRDEGESYPTFFEMIFAIGMLLFKDRKVSVVVMEAGMGGLSDTTNVVKRPVVSVITSISLEHTEYLGDTIELIAAQKAGIIREGVPVVYDACNPEAAAVIRETAEEKNAAAYPVSNDDVRIAEWSEEGILFSFQCDFLPVRKYRIPFVAEYQTVNAGLAITAFCTFVQEMGLNVGENASKQPLLSWIYHGLSTAMWPGRMQQIEKEVYFDGAHNEGGIREFVSTVGQLCRDDENPPILLYSMVREKDHQACIRHLTTIPWNRIVISRVEGERGTDPKDLAAGFPEECQFRIDVIDDAKAAYAHCLELKEEGQKFFATGSLYFIGTLLEEC